MPASARQAGKDPRVADTLAELVDVLVAARHRQGVLQTDVAAMLGVTPVSVCRWEQHVASPELEHLVLYARALGLAVCVVDEAGHRLTVWGAPAPRAGERPACYWVRCTVLVLRDARLGAGLKQEQIAAKLGVATWSVQMWENSRRTPRLSHLLAWCAVLGYRLELREC